MENLSVTEQLMYSTARIECEYTNGGSGTGSGFFFRFLEKPETGEHVPVLITNKHVINGATKGKIIFCTSTTNGLPNDKDHFSITIDGFEQYWRKHPDINVDLCAMPIANFIKAAIEKGKTLFYITIDRSLIRSQAEVESLSAVEEILMIGYPTGLWDSINNKPLMRKGITATHPKFNYNGKREFVIDAACFPGSSGSPVFLCNIGGYTDKKGNLMWGNDRIWLLGVLYAGPQYAATGDIQITEIPTSQRPISITPLMINLGHVIKSERILELETLFK